MKRILLLLLLFSLLFTACAEETGEETGFTPGPARLFSGTAVYADEARTKESGVLEGSLVVYASALIETEDARTLKVCYLYEGTVRIGYVDFDDASFLTVEQIESYLTEMGEGDGSYGGLPLVNAVFKQKEEPDAPEEPDKPDRPKRKKETRITGEERGTPGVYTHVKGTWEMDSYWGVDTSSCETEGGVLILGTEEIGISGEELTAAVEGETLILTGGKLTVSGEALLTLRESGITSVLANGIPIPTDGFLSGSIYDLLRSEGIADRRIDFEMDETLLTARVMGETYLVKQNADTLLWELERSGA